MSEQNNNNNISDLLSKILEEVSDSKEYNREIFNEVKGTLKEFEDDIQNLQNKGTIDKQDLKDIISKVEKGLEKRIDELEKEQNQKFNDIEKEMIRVDIKTEENTKDHKMNKDNLLKITFLIISAFVGLIVYVIKGS